LNSVGSRQYFCGKVFDPLPKGVLLRLIACDPFTKIYMICWPMHPLAFSFHLITRVKRQLCASDSVREARQLSTSRTRASSARVERPDRWRKIKFSPYTELPTRRKIKCEGARRIRARLSLHAYP